MASWQLDKDHSEIGFKVRHLMISVVKGRFRNFDVNFQSETEDLSQAQIKVAIDIASIDTQNEQRDQHLRSADFFNAEANPQITFVSKQIIKRHDDEFDLVGDLTIKGVSREVTLRAELGGVVRDPWGNAKVGYTVRGAINRNDYGLNWNATLEAGGVMVSEEVRFTANIQFIKS